MKTYSFLYQAFIYALIMLLANGLAFLSPIPIPASVIGLILLFTALSTKIIRLEQVEGLANSLSNVITFLFVPSGISLINSLGIMQSAGIQIIFVILVATLALLGTTGWSAAFLLHVKDSLSRRKTEAGAIAKEAKEVRS